jgi:type II secretory pathway pseudopilin PulG
VLVVLLVVALAAAVVVPSLGRSADALRVRAEVAGFAGFLRYAREQAITRREAQEVRVDPEARLLMLGVPGSDVVRSTKRLSPLLQIEPEAPAALTVRFLPHGPSSGGTFRVWASGGRVYVVTVDPLTGRVSNRRADS